MHRHLDALVLVDYGVVLAVIGKFIVGIPERNDIALNVVGAEHLRHIVLIYYLLHRFHNRGCFYKLYNFHSFYYSAFWLHGPLSRHYDSGS